MFIVEEGVAGVIHYRIKCLRSGGDNEGGGRDRAAVGGEEMTPVS